MKPFTIKGQLVEVSNFNRRADFGEPVTDVNIALLGGGQLLFRLDPLAASRAGVEEDLLALMKSDGKFGCYCEIDVRFLPCRGPKP